MSEFPHIALRFDGGGAVGFGHATRCLALARAIQAQSAHKVRAHVRQDPVVEKFFVDAKIDVVTYPAKQSEEAILESMVSNPSVVAIVIDRIYPFTLTSISQAAEHVPVTMLHNECEGMAACKAVIFPAAHFSEAVLERLYKGTRDGCLYHGFKYVLLGAACLKHSRERPGDYTSFASGASDPAAILVRLLEWAGTLTDYATPIKALYGQSFLHHAAMERMADSLPEQCRIEPFSPSVFFQSRSAVCAFGVSIYELLYHRIPFLTVAHIPKSADGSRVLANKIGLPIDLGLIDDLQSKRFKEAFAWLRDPGNEAAMREKIDGLVDGKGVERVAKIILNTL
jgi:spore coat polysaccharide biosynthesis predicted glycosyltransferase SpsG